MTRTSESQIASSWNKTQSQVLSYAKVEKKLAVKNLISRYHEYEEHSNDSESCE